MTPLHYKLIYVALIALFALAAKRYMRDKPAAQPAEPDTDDLWFVCLRKEMTYCRTLDDLKDARDKMYNKLPARYHRYTLAIFYGQYWKLQHNAS